MKRIRKFTPMLALLAACSSQGPKQFLDSTVGADAPPKWAKSTKMAWTEDNLIKVKATYTARGDERVSGCFDLAKLDLKESLLSEISMELKGSIENATSSISESAENFLSKVRSGVFEGKLSGLRQSEQYFERYKIGETERIDCYVLAEMKQADYERLKSNILNHVEALDPNLKRAMLDKQISFVKGPQPASTAKTEVPVETEEP